MESLLLSIISQYLKDYVNNFKRDQVSLNFLRGQGVIRNLDINVGAINEAIFQSSVPALRFTRIMINTLSVEAPIMNLKNKPITFFIDRLFIEIAEVVDIEKRPPKKTPKKAASAKYGFIDRVLDCLSFEINRTTVAIQTLGRMKTTSVGPWTPPVVLIELSGARVFCTNHNGLETELDECLRIRPTKRPLLFLYKKLEVERASFYLINPELWVTVAEELMKDVSVANLSGLNLKSGTRGFVKLKIFNNTPLQVMMSMRKRMDNNFLLGLELAVTFEAVKINLRKQCLTELLHFLMGMHFCLFRLDSIEELYGQDPYSEGFSSCSVGVGSAGFNRTPIAGTAAAASDRRNRRRAQFGQAENESLDRLEAEMITGGAVVADEDERAEDWHRSSLNSDDDPPHMRFVTVIQVTDATITIHLEHTDQPAAQSPAIVPNAVTPLGTLNNTPAAYTAAHTDTRITPLPVAVILRFQGLVHTTVSPEHAASTESVIQTTLQGLTLTEQIGIKKTRLLWTKEPLDLDGRPIFVVPIPRGVKEYSHDDLETIPGTSFILKKNSRYPPPPLFKGTAISSEMCICELGINVKVETFDSITSLFMRSWDERMGSGEWGVVPTGILVTTIKAGSSESVMMLSGLDILIYPSTDQELTSGINLKPIHHTTAPKGCLTPSEINLKVGLMTLVRKPSMDISIMGALLDLDLDSTSVIEKDQESDGDENDVLDGKEGNEREGEREGKREREREREEALRGASSYTNRAHFPHSSDDLSQALRAVIDQDSQRGGMSTPEKIPPSPSGVGMGTVELPDTVCGVGTAPLLKVRFEASMAEISLIISADITQRHRGSTGAKVNNRSARSMSNSSGKVCMIPQSRQLVKPFSLHYLSTLDLNPFLPSLPLKRPASAYNRDYYLTPNSSTISSSYLSVEGLAINSSLLDLIRALHVVETTTHLVRISTGYGLLFNPSPPSTIKSIDGLSRFDAKDSTASPMLPCESTVVTKRAVKPASISMFKSTNVDIHIVPANDPTAPAVLSLVTKFVRVVLERPLTAVDTAGGSEIGLDASIAPVGSSAIFSLQSPEGGREGEREGVRDGDRDGESGLSSPDDWSDWVCEDALHPIAASSPATAAAPVTLGLSHDRPPTPQTRTLIKLVCGNLVLSANSRPLFYLLGNSTVKDALSQVTWSGLLGKHRRQQATAGDGAPFLLIRCELSSLMSVHRHRQVEDDAKSNERDEDEDELHVKPVECSHSFNGMNGHGHGHQTSSTVDSQNSSDPRSSISLQIKAPCSSMKKTSSGRSAGSRCLDNRPDNKHAGERRVGQVVLLPQVLETCLHGVIKELLEGFGYVHVGAAKWWKDTVYGYLTERLGVSKGLDCYSEIMMCLYFV